MASYPPPTENLPIFDTSVFTTNDAPLTQSSADLLYLKFPIGQGTETLPALVVAGTTTTDILASTTINNSGTTTSASFVGALTGNASTATNIAGGTAGKVPYQTGAGLTNFTAVGTAGQVLTSQGTGAPIWSAGGGGGAGTLSATLALGNTATNKIILNNIGSVGAPTTNVITIDPDVNNAGLREARIVLTDGTTTNTLDKNGMSATSLTLSSQATINNIVIKKPLGTNNFLVGAFSLANTNVSSYDNLVVGTNIGSGITSGNNNTLVGNSGFSTSNCSNTTSFGANNGTALTTGTNNTFLGKDTMNFLTTGSNNVAVGGTAVGGAYTGGNLTTGSNNTFLGTTSRANVGNVSNSTALGYGAVITGSNQIVLGTATENVSIPGTATATTFIGALTGTATEATAITITDTTSDATTFFPTFVNSAGTNKTNRIDSTGLTYVPSTNTLSCTNFTGTATHAVDIDVTDTTATAGTFFPTFVNVAGTQKSIRCDTTGLSYVPSTDTLICANFTGTASRSTNIAGGLGGSIPYQTAVNTTALLANGTAGQVLTSQGTTLAPIWAAGGGGGGPATNIAGGVAGAIPYQSAPSTTLFSAAGTAGQILQSNGTGAPTWSSALIDANVLLGGTTARTGASTTKVAIGSLAGITTQGTSGVAIGTSAGNNNQAGSSVAIGTSAGATSQGSVSVAIGSTAGEISQAGFSVAIGSAAGRNTQGSGAIAIGAGSGATSQGGSSIAIGNDAGYSNVKADTISIGSLAGGQLLGLRSVAIGRYTCFDGGNGTGEDSVSLGNQANHLSFNFSVALGYNAKCTASNQIMMGTTSTTTTIPRNIRYVSPPMFSFLFATTSQSIPNSTDTIVNYPVADSRNGLYTGLTYSAGTFTNSNAFSVTLNVNIALNFDNSAVGYRLLYISSSVQGRIAAMYSTPASTRQTGLSLSATFVLLTTETFNTQVFQTSGGALSISSTATDPQRISVLVM